MLAVLQLAGHRSAALAACVLPAQLTLLPPACPHPALQHKSLINKQGKKEGFPLLPPL